MHYDKAIKDMFLYVAVVIGTIWLLSCMGIHLIAVGQ